MSLSGWGNYPKLDSDTFEYAQDESLKAYIAEQKDLIAYGNGRSYGDSALSRHIVEIRPHHYFLDFDASSGVLCVQAGVLLAEILESFVPRGWFLKITPGTKFVTIGGAIASDVHGKNHHNAGCFSEAVINLDLMLPDGQIISCSKTQNPELFRATCGGMGLTGIILSAQIALKKINSNQIIQTTVKTRNLEETFSAFSQYGNESYSVAWIDCLARGDSMGRSILMTGDFADDGKLDYAHKTRLNIPFYFPAWLLNRFSVKAFNWLYYHKNRQIISQQKVGIDTFFYPLDAILNWNRIYGRNGFIQYQFILPLETSFNGLTELLEKISASGKGSFLAVLKLHGKSNNNYLSFPLEGYSLALDFKMEPGLFDLLNQLDEILLRYGGRIYLAKDARVSKTTFEKGYPLINQFRELRKAYKMNQKFNSLQSQRVDI